MKRWLWLLLLWAPMTFSFENADISWVPPTTRNNGVPMADSEIARYDIYCWQDPLQSDIDQVGSIANTGGTSNWVSADGAFPPGDYFCAVTAIDTGGLESDFSNTANFTVAASRPSAPTGLTVTIPGAGQ